MASLLIILVALLFIAPNVPGAGTDFAKVITVLIGVIVSFSSTTTVGNFLAGVVLAYMRPFRRGDRVRVGDIVGDVVDPSFLHTRLRTPKNEKDAFDTAGVEIMSPHYVAVRDGNRVTIPEKES